MDVQVGTDCVSRSSISEDGGIARSFWTASLSGRMGGWMVRTEVFSGSDESYGRCPLQLCSAGWVWGEFVDEWPCWISWWSLQYHCRTLVLLSMRSSGCCRGKCHDPVNQSESHDERRCSTLLEAVQSASFAWYQAYVRTRQRKSLTGSAHGKSRKDDVLRKRLAFGPPLITPWELLGCKDEQQWNGQEKGLTYGLTQWRADGRFN